MCVFDQVKQLPRERVLQLADLILVASRWDYDAGAAAADGMGDANRALAAELAGRLADFGVAFDETAAAPGGGALDVTACGAAAALLLFGDSERSLPGGYSANEAREPRRRVRLGWGGMVAGVAHARVRPPSRGGAEKPKAPY